MFLRILAALTLLFSACGNGNVCERQLTFEEQDCFPELEQPTMVDKEDCDGDVKEYAKCATKNEDAYCAYFLWKNRAAARQHGYTVSDTLAPNNDFVACIDEAGLREQ